MAAHVEGLSRRGVPAVAVDLPLRRAEAAVPAYREAVARVSGQGPSIVISGQSYGGRVASLLAAADPGVYAGLVCLSYPLHRPGQPDWEVRTTHWPQLDLPVLLLSGEADPFARVDLLSRARAERLPAARLVTYPGVGHSLKPVLDTVLDEMAAFIRELESVRGDPYPAR